ncbi:MAG TPA: group 1 truncated hemoglobin [Thermodesulfobacteriota bacterium]|nr:group 1 truncated hemoglobin [Thermodesulfobacteriota bacterium]
MKANFTLKRRMTMQAGSISKRVSYVFSVLVLAVLLNMPYGIAQDDKSQKSLYERLGGYDAIAAVIGDFFKRMINDPQLGRFFIGLSTDSKMRAQQLTVDFVCQATGGPCLYTGRDMKTVHTGLNINEDDWNLSAKHLSATLDKFNVPEKEKSEVLNLITSLKGVIVTPQAVH